MKKMFFALIFSIGFIINAQIPCVVIQWNNDSTSFTVVNYNYNPTSLPILGLSPGLEVLVKRTPYAVPEYDTRLKVLLTSYNVSEEFDSQYSTNRKWLENFSLIDRTISEQIISVDEAENFANYQVVPTEKQFFYMFLMGAINYRLASGMTLTSKEQTIADRYIAKAQRIYSNRILADAKKDSLNTGSLVDLDNGWENVDPEDEE